MDYSAFTEAQQQQYQQYQQQDQHHHQQPYDPAQAQAYETYYASYQQQQQQRQYDGSAYHHQQYHPHDYSAASATAYHPPQPAPQPEPAPAPAPQLPAHDPSLIHAPQHHHQHPGHGYPPPVAGQEQHGGPGYQVPPDLNPAAAAAVAALSQLTQFAGTMDAAERAMAGMQDRQWHGRGGGMMMPMAEGPHQPPPPHHHYPQHTHYPMQHGATPVRPSVGGRSPYRGGGRRGGGPFRGGGGGRGNFGHHPTRQDGAPSPFRGRGRGRMGRGGGRRSHQSDTQLPHSGSAPVVESSSASEPAQAPGQAPVQAPAPAPALAPAVVMAPKLPRVPLLPVASCDICRVDCNSLEILEQHKNGKRHKKTVKRFEEIQAQQRLLAGLQAKVVSKTEMVLPRVEENKASQVGGVNKAPAQVGEPKKASVASESVPAEIICAQVGEANKAPAATENMPTPVLPTEQKMEPKVESQTVEGQSEPTEAETAAEVLPSDAPAAKAQPTDGGYKRPRMDGYDRFDRRHGPKRKMTRFGRGGKRLRYFEQVYSRPVERPKEQRPKDQPRYCTVCNVMCDTQAVFECHLSGKKHISRIKRFQGQEAVYGPISVYIPPNQPTASQGLEPLFYGLKSHEMLQQEAYGFNGLQLEFFGQQQGDQAAQAREAEGAALEFQAERGLEHPKEEVLPANGGQEDVNLDPEGQNVVVEFEAKEQMGQNAVAEFEAKEQIAFATEFVNLDEATFNIAEDFIPVP